MGGEDNDQGGDAGRDVANGVEQDRDKVGGL